MSGFTSLSALAGTSLFQSVGQSLPIPSELKSLLLRNQRQIGTIIPDCTIEENHSDRVTVTQHPVADGTPMSDHLYRMPYSVTVRYGWTNANGLNAAISGFTSGGGFSDLGGALSGAGSGLLSSATEQRVTEIYKKLRKLQFDNDAWNNGQSPATPFQLTTGKRTYDNMVIVELSVRTDRTTEYSLMVEAHFQEVLIAKTSSTTQPAQGDQANPSQTASPNDQGDQSPSEKTNPNSYLRSGANAAAGKPASEEIPK